MMLERIRQKEQDNLRKEIARISTTKWEISLHVSSTMLSLLKLNANGNGNGMVQQWQQA
jgi:hypothetical protein